MPNRILVVNAGSSSLKFKLYDWLPGSELVPSVNGLLERVGQPESTVTVQACSLPSEPSA